MNGLREVHSNKLLHLYVMLADTYTRVDGTLILLDLGAARQMLKADQLQHPIYTPGFAPSEVCDKIGCLGPQSDMCSVGASMFACMVGAPPQPADQRESNGKMDGYFHELEGHYSSELIEVIRWSLMMDPARRPHSVFEMQKALQKSADVEPEPNDLLLDMMLPRTRAKLYDTMRCTVFSKSHRKCKDEAYMVEGKENTVEATCDIAEGSCLGAYGGFGLTGEDFGAPMDDKIEPDKGYIMRAAKTCGQETREAEEDDTKVAEIDGNNILSLINTIFEWKKGIPHAQAKLGYNVEFVGFRGILKDGSEVNLTFVFAKCNIKAGEELRVNYHYTKKTIADIFAFPSGKRANTEPNIEIEEVEPGDDESALVARFAACEVEER